MTPKAFVTALTGGALENHDIKLVVINEANKAYGHSALSRLVSLVMNEGANVRVLGLAETLSFKKVATVQSIISNLCLSNVLIKNYSDGSELNKVLYPFGVKVQRIKWSSKNSALVEHLNAWKEVINKPTEQTKYVSVFSAFRGHQNSRKKLVAAEFLTESDPDGLIFSENWQRIIEVADEEWKPAIHITSSLVGAYRMLALYGYRAFYLCLKSKFLKQTQLLNSITDSADLRSVYEYAETNYSFSANPIPSSELFEIMKASHPKMPKLIDLLDQYLPTKTDDYKLMVFCESCFGARAVAELLLAHNTFSFKENWSELNNLMGDKAFQGSVIEDKRWVINKFKSSNISILVSSSFVENLSSHEIFDCAIGMDYCTASLRYLKYGDKARHCLLMDVQELLPSSAFCCDWLQPKHLFCNESLYRFEKSMNPFEKLGTMSEIPIEYIPNNLAPEICEDKSKKNVAKKINSVKETSEEPNEIAKLAAFDLTEAQMQELEKFGIGASWDWKASSRGIKDCFSYEADLVPELCDHPALTPLDEWCSYSRSVNSNDEFLKKLRQQFKCHQLVDALKEDKEMIAQGDIKHAEPELGANEMVVNKRRKKVESSLTDEKKPRKRAKKILNCVQAEETAQRQVITNHFQFIRSLSADDFRNPVAESSIDRENAFLRILNMFELFGSPFNCKDFYV